MLDVVYGEGRQDHEEVAQVRQLLVAELRREHLHQEVEILVAALKARGQVVQRLVQSLGHRHHLRGQGLGLGELGELGDVLDVGDKPDAGVNILEKIQRKGI